MTPRRRGRLLKVVRRVNRWFHLGSTEHTIGCAFYGCRYLEAE